MVKTENRFLTMLFGVLGAVAITSLDSSWYDKITRYGIYNGNTIEQILHNIAQGDITRIHRAMIDAIKSGMSLSEARKAVTDEMVKTKRFIRHEINSIINGVVNDTAMAFAAGNCGRLSCRAENNQRKETVSPPTNGRRITPMNIKHFCAAPFFPEKTNMPLIFTTGFLPSASRE